MICINILVSVKRQEVSRKEKLMSKKRRNRHKTEHKEAQFDFDDAKELTVGEAMRKK